MSMFTMRFRVYYEDTDASGVMYHARYLAFFERARTEYLRHAGFSQDALMREQNIAFTLSDVAVKYRSPARLDDELDVSVAVERLGAASLSFSQTMRCGDRLCATAQVRAGCVAMDTFKPTAMPGAVRQALEKIECRSAT